MARKRRKGEGSIRSRLHRGERVWFIDVMTPHGRVRQTIGAGQDGRRAAEAELTRIVAEIRLDRYTPPARRRTVRFGDFVTGWLERKYDSLRPASFRTYRYLVETHLRPDLGSVALSEFTREMLELYRARKARENLAARTLNLLMLLVGMVLRDALDLEYLTKDPTRKLKRLRVDDDPAKPKVYEPDQLQRLLAVAAEPYKTAYVVAVLAGLRKSEVCGLKWSDVRLTSPTAGTVRITRQVQWDKGRGLVEVAPKSDKSLRTVRLPQVAVEALWNLPTRGEWVFTRDGYHPLHPNTLYVRLKHDVKKAGLPQTLGPPRVAPDLRKRPGTVRGEPEGSSGSDRPFGRQDHLYGLPSRLPGA